jgi:hypothetical protein
MKKLVLAIGLVIASSVSVLSQEVNTYQVDDNFNSFMQSENFNICLFSKSGNGDNNTDLFKISDKFFIDSNVRMKFANDPNVGRLRVTYQEKQNRFLLFKEFIQETNWDIDKSLTKLETHIEYDEGYAVVDIIIYNPDMTQQKFLEMVFEFKPTNSTNVDKIKMNLHVLQYWE